MSKGIFQGNPLPNVNLEETTFTTLAPSVNPKKETKWGSEDLIILHEKIRKQYYPHMLPFYYEPVTVPVDFGVICRLLCIRW